MNLRDLRYLVALADHRHFGRAAEACHVSQPTLSGQVAKLEERLGVSLLERDSRNVALTEAGEAVVVEARAALAHAAMIEEIARTRRDPLAGGLRLGMIVSLGPFLAPDLLTVLTDLAPRLEITLVEATTDALVASLRARTLDAALLATAVEGQDLVELPLLDEPLMVGLAPDHPLAAKARVTRGDLEPLPALLMADGHCLRHQALALCALGAAGGRLEAASLITLMRLAARGPDLTIVPGLAADAVGGLAVRPIDDPAASRRLRLVTRRHYPRQGAIAVIASAIRSLADGRLGCRLVEAGP